MQHLNSIKELEDLKNSQSDFVLDFYADWCWPCKNFSPHFEAASKSNPNIKFYKVNVEEASEVSEQFSIMSIPTICFFKNWTLVKTESSSERELFSRNLIEIYS